MIGSPMCKMIGSPMRPMIGSPTQASRNKRIEKGFDA